MHNLASTLRAQGELAEAHKLQEKTLEIRRRVLGPEHPHTLSSMNSLSLTLDAMGDLVAERKLQVEMLGIYLRVLGPEHRDTSIAAWNLFQTLRDLRKNEEARAVLERDLLWLLDRESATLGADQRKIREYVDQEVKNNLPGK
jgi:Tetratricopeptide repeat